MTPQELKNSILQLAIQGKLVEQRPEEGTAAELVEKILAAKNAKSAKVGRSPRDCRVSARNGGRGATALPLIPDDEKPFDIPESWEWVRLGDVFQHNTGKALNSSDKAGTPLSYITTSNVYWNRFELCKLKTMLFSDSEVEKCTIRKGDLLVLEGGDVGRAAIWNYDFSMRIQNHIHRLRPLIDICVQYVYYIFMLYKNANMISGKGISIKGLSANALHNLPIPLPPLAEQKRIVAKIEELLPLIDRYEKAWSKLEDFNKRFPVDMQKSLLQMAIQGKLVEQRAEEGTAAELVEKILAAKNAKGAKKNSRAETQSRREKKSSALSASPREKIPDDEKPFDIPKSWEWVRHNALFEIVGGSQPPKSKFRDTPQEGYVRLYQIRDYGERPVPVYVPTKMVSKFTQKGDILLARYGGSLGKIFWAENGAYNVAMAKVVRLYEGNMVDNKYLYYYYLAPLYQTLIKGNTRSAQAGFNKEDLNYLLFPLPPLAEQKRIVAKLEELLPLCERLK